MDDPDTHGMSGAGAFFPGGFVSAELFELPPEAAALLATFPDRLTEAERRIDRSLARLGVE